MFLKVISSVAIEGLGLNVYCFRLQVKKLIIGQRGILSTPAVSHLIRTEKVLGTNNVILVFHKLLIDVSLTQKVE